MFRGKARYLERLTPKFYAKQEFGEHIEGASPPSIFVGRFGYPKVFLGPLLPPIHGDTAAMDTPEAWLQNASSVADVISFRMQLVRGMHVAEITDVQDSFVEQMREVALAKNSVEMQASFTKKPRGTFFNEEMQPFGPSAPIKEVDFTNAKMDVQLGKMHYDTDLKAADAVTNLYEKGLMISTIQKAFSTGAFGTAKRRRLVPTRWSITAVDDTIGKRLIAEIKQNSVLDAFQLYEFYGFKNYFAILLTPATWQYEFLEAFLGIFGNEQMLFSDYEKHEGRKNYAQIGGCYYACRLAVAEKLQQMQRQAGAIVFRESYSGYVPTGVWLVRESARRALESRPKEFADVQSALNYLENRLQLPMWRYRKESRLMKQILVKTYR
ncbi:MAG: hypothetical protein HYW25_01100 [Candidatus Aenigmarchaeota archaeon]|nr:hypothetical protein [Candidatus Aenigmarchaeota archaeon]